jgi:hypothetical protein
MEKIDNIVENVRQKLLERSQVGIKKYNTTLDENNHDNYLNHLQQELMDAANYIEKLLVQKTNITDLVKKHPNDQELGEVIRNIYSNG